MDAKIVTSTNRFEARHVYGDKITTALEVQKDLAARGEQNKEANKSLKDKIQATEKAIQRLDQASQNFNLNAMHTQPFLMLVIFSQSLNATKKAFEESLKQKYQDDLDKITDGEKEIFNDMKSNSERMDKLLKLQAGGEEFIKKYKEFQNEYANFKTLEYFTTNPSEKMSPKQIVDGMNFHKQRLEDIAKSLKVPFEEDGFVTFNNLDEFEKYCDKYEVLEFGESNYRKGTPTISADTTTQIDAFLDSIKEPVGSQTGLESILTQLSPIVTNYFDEFSHPDKKQEENIQKASSSSVSGLLEQLQEEQRAEEVEQAYMPTKI